MDKFFLSYARADQDFALRLATDLRWAGCAIWVDQFDIQPSQLWDRTVEAAVRECSGLLLVLSPRSVASENVLDEVSVAIDSRKPIVPVLYEACVLPLRLARVQFIDATKDYQLALERCKSAIGSAMETGGTPLSGAAAAPSGAAFARPALAPEIVARADKLLTAHLGPIASVLVQKAALQAVDEADLFARAAASIANEGERAVFLSQARQGPAPARQTAEPPPAARPAFDPTYLDKVAGVLTHYLGPLAGHIVKREQQAAADPEDLFKRLSARVPNGRERAELLGKLRAISI